MPAFAWKLIAVLALACAALATALPVLPALPFLLLAAMAAGRGWPWLEQGLSSQATLGPILRNWRLRGTLPRSVKLAGLAGLAISAVTAWLLPIPAWLAAMTHVVLLGIGIWLIRRPTS